MTEEQTTLHTARNLLILSRPLIKIETTKLLVKCNLLSVKST